MSFIVKTDWFKVIFVQQNMQKVLFGGKKKSGVYFSRITPLLTSSALYSLLTAKITMDSCLFSASR